jgi:hypothetical protein
MAQAEIDAAPEFFYSSRSTSKKSLLISLSFIE